MTAKRLVFVTGKGGTGKSSIAAGLAIAAANSALKVLLIDVEQRHSFGPVFGFNLVPSKSTKVTTVAGSLEILSLDPTDSLLSYLDKFYGLRIAGGLLTSVGAVDFATDIAPGLKDILLVGFACDAARQKTNDVYRYDLVIVDAPPTGRIEKFLTVADTISAMAPIGPINQQAQLVRDEVTATTSQVLIVVNPEELSITEALSARYALTSAGIDVGPLIVNQAPDEIAHEFSDEEYESARAHIMSILKNEHSDADHVLQVVKELHLKHRDALGLIQELRADHEVINIPQLDLQSHEFVENELVKLLQPLLKELRK